MGREAHHAVKTMRTGRRDRSRLASQNSLRRPARAGHEAVSASGARASHGHRSAPGPLPSIIDAYPPVPTEVVSVRPFCCALLQPELQEKILRWKKEGRKWHKSLQMQQAPEGTCANKARYVIDGKWYCRKHAGLLVLDSIAVVKRK